MTYRMTWKGAMVGAYSSLMYGVTEFEAVDDAAALSAVDRWRKARKRPVHTQYVERIDVRERAVLIGGDSFMTPPRVVKNLVDDPTD